MVLFLDSNLEIGAHVWSENNNLIYEFDLLYMLTFSYTQKYFQNPFESANLKEFLSRHLRSSALIYIYALLI